MEVAKAREFEPYKQLPRFSHKQLAVISPLPKRRHREPSHKAPSSLAFDGSKLSLSAKKSLEREIPEHLVRPAIDEEKLMKIREREKLMNQKANSKYPRKVSLAVQKAEQAAAKNKAELTLKIKRAEKNLKQFFSECKKILEKPNEDLVYLEARALVE